MSYVLGAALRLVAAERRQDILSTLRVQKDIREHRCAEQVNIQLARLIAAATDEDYVTELVKELDEPA